uniref:Uncharacterized protein n=1 Tax=Populus trichocarpa TaxID=3694 RepID=A0A2K2A532_POPTR
MVLHFLSLPLWSSPYKSEVPSTLVEMSILHSSQACQTPLTTTYESFFRLHDLSQVLDRTDPLTQVVHGRKSVGS